MNKAVAAREIMLLGALKEVRSGAAGASIEVAALKGAALLELGFYQPGERGMTDADVLVRPRDQLALEGILKRLGFEPMANSADAWVRSGSVHAPPAIIDLHTGLWHIKDIEELFSRGLEPGPEGLVMNLCDIFLHLASHRLLYHGELDMRSLEDCARVARKGCASGGVEFWARAARKAGLYRLRPVIWPVMARLSGNYPGLLGQDELALFSPRGGEKIKAVLFEKAAAKHCGPLEYLLPVLYRPGLFFNYLFPERRFMERRYGSASRAAYLARPFRLLAAVIRG